MTWECYCRHAKRITVVIGSFGSTTGSSPSGQNHGLGVLGGESVGILVIPRFEPEDVCLEIDRITLWHHLLIEPVLVALLHASWPGAELRVDV